VPREYTTQCWSCLGEFDAAAAVWCTCSSRTPTKLCPFCIHCFCQADPEYQENFWQRAPEELKEEREILNGASGTIGESLIRSNLLNTDQLVAALRWQQGHGGTLEQALIDLSFVSRDNLDVVSYGHSQSGASVDLSKQLVDASLATAISIDLCYRKRILPISKEEIGGKQVLTLAMAGPTDVETIDQIQSLTNCRIIPMSASEQEILDRLADLFPKEVESCRAQEAAAPAARAGPAVARAAPRPAAPAGKAATARPSPAARSPGARGRRAAPKAPAAAAPAPLDEVEELEEITPEPDPEPVAAPRAAKSAAPAAGAASSAPAGAVSPDADAALQKILSEAIAHKASQIQIEVRGAALSLFLRIDGSLYRVKPPALATPASLARAAAARASLQPGQQPATGRLGLKIGERRVELLVRRLPFSGGESVLLKIVDPTDVLRRFEDLGLSAHDRERIVRALALPTGLIVVSGPPHNGVAVTLYSMLAHLAGEKRRVVSLESPLLLSVDGARQVEIGTPPDAARARLEIDGHPGAEALFLPDLGTPGLAALAVEKAGSSLVVASVQARRASQAPGAILWHQVDPGTLGGALKLVVGQRLVRRVCDGCRGPLQVADRVLKMMGLTPDESLDLSVFQGSGCEKCGTLSPGYAGRVALFEVMEGTAELGTLIAANAPPGEIEREARRGGMSPLRAACLALVGQGITTLEEFQKGNF